MIGKNNQDGTTTIEIEPAETLTAGDNKHYRVCEFCNRVIVVDKSLAEAFCMDDHSLLSLLSLPFKKGINTDDVPMLFTELVTDLRPSAR